MEKKRQYNERVLEVENGTFTPLVFSTNGAMGREGITFYKRLGEMYTEKKKLPVSATTTAIRTKVSFSLLRSTIRCVRGSRSRQTNLEGLDMPQESVFSSE